jgi:hypothetical protein
MNIALKMLILLSLVAAAVGRGCPHGIPEVRCVQAPCRLAREPPCPEAFKCVDNYCGGCNFDWYNENGSLACV